MIAERDITIPPRSQQGQPAKRGWLFGIGRKTPRRARRGEREAHNLLWRRRFRAAQRILTIFLVVGGLAAGVETWRGGLLDEIGQAAGARLDRMVVQAGLTVEEVRIKGQNRTPLAEVRQALALQPGQSIFAIDLDVARDRIEKLSWVKEASVSRQLPNGLQVNVIERKPFALWQDRGHLWLIDAEGVRLTDRGLGRFGQLPMVVGDGAAQKAARLLTLLKADPVMFGRVQSSIRVSDRRWDLVMSNGVRVRLPDEGEAEAYALLGRLQKESEILERNIELVDLRVAGQLVVRLDHQLAEEERAARAKIKRDVKAGRAAAAASAASGQHHGKEI